MVDSNNTGQNYLINDTHTILASSTQTFTFELTGVAGRIRLVQIVKSDNRQPKCCSCAGSLAPFDLLLQRLTVERFEATRPQDLLIDGEPPIDEITGNGGGLPALLAAIELLQARSRVLMDIRNTTDVDVRLSLTLVGYSVFDEDLELARFRGGFAVTERGGQQVSR